MATRLPLTVSSGRCIASRFGTQSWFCSTLTFSLSFLHPSDVRIPVDAVIQFATDIDLLQRDFPGVEPRPKLPRPGTPQYLPPSRKRHRSPPSSSFEYSPRSSGLRSRSGNYGYGRTLSSSYAIRPVSPLYNPSPGKHRRSSTTVGANALFVRPKEPDTLTVQVCIVCDCSVPLYCLTGDHHHTVSETLQGREGCHRSPRKNCFYAQSFVPCTSLHPQVPQS